MDNVGPDFGEVGGYDGNVWDGAGEEGGGRVVGAFKPEEDVETGPADARVGGGGEVEEGEEEEVAVEVKGYERAGPHCFFEKDGWRCVEG